MRPALTNALTNAIRSAFSYTANGAAEAEQWVAQLDGATQAWRFSESFQTELDDVITFKYIGPENPESDTSLVGRDANYAGVVILREREGGVLELNGASVSIDGTSYPGGSLYPKYPGVMEAQVVINTRIRIETLLGTFANKDAPSFTWRMQGGIFDFKVTRNDQVVLHLPLNNKSQGGTQLPTVGNISANLINYTEAVWRKP